MPHSIVQLQTPPHRRCGVSAQRDTGIFASSITPTPTTAGKGEDNARKTIIPPGLEAIAKGQDSLTTEEAGPVINRRPKTLRKWASEEHGPIRPVRIHGCLSWRVADLAALLTGKAVK
ncbi:hypothetical protein [Silvimonas amylolytica]|uniref:Helix-turn-helix domain-containing protein n=1 Tax=Silvimonas amylolytica TaxID=449663 RepID=A0ABQ2PJT8_9NEIS|nr:hypothetical protein [Silvimonas amylolytica]GGP25865.1 hypothetical protein GCM10010971_16840 [Silvimonas amylolytica]